MRRRTLFIAAGLALVLAAGAAALLAAHHSGTARASAAARLRAGAPPAAVATIRQLTSASAVAQRGAVTPELASLLPAGPLFPPGTRFRPDPHGWRQSGAYANVTGTLQEPGQAPAPAEIGLERRGKRWLVTFEAAR
jgi:hypothetical protein